MAFHFPCTQRNHPGTLRMWRNRSVCREESQMNPESRLLSSRVTHPFDVTRIHVGLALMAVYVIWGSTYLAVRIALESFPPLLMSSFRFLLAGGLLYLVLRARGIPAPSPRQ